MISKNLSNNSHRPKGNMKQYHWISLMCFVATFLCTTLPILMEWMDKVQDGRNTHYVT